MKTQVKKSQDQKKAFSKNLFKKQFSSEMQNCIEKCIDCHQACEQLIQYCLEKGEDSAEPHHIRTLQDCTELCAISANLMMRESAFHNRICLLCADVCTACAESCDTYPDDEAMKMCGEICQQCAEACRASAKHH